MYHGDPVAVLTSGHHTTREGRVGTQLGEAEADGRLGRGFPYTVWSLPLEETGTHKELHIIFRSFHRRGLGLIFDLVPV